MAKLKELRTARGISQEDLAALVGVSRQTISKWENAVVQPSADNQMRLSQALRFPLEVFLRDDWKPPEHQAVEAVSILPKTPQDTDSEPAVVTAEKSPKPDLAPAASPAEMQQVPADEVLPPRRRNYRLWAAVIAVIGIIAGVISFNRRDVDTVSISELEQEEMNGPITESGNLQPLQP